MNWQNFARVRLQLKFAFIIRAKRLTVEQSLFVSHFFSHIVKTQQTSIRRAKFMQTVKDRFLIGNSAAFLQVG